MQKESSAVYTTSRDGVINLSSINCLGQEIKSFSGWIQDVKHGRIFVITCAHNILSNGITMPATSYFSATVENATSNKGKENIAVSMKLLGADVSADIAVLYSILPCEQTKQDPFGYEFAANQAKLNWATSKDALSVSLISGTPVYSISNAYNNGLTMTVAYMEDDDVIYNTLDVAYSNFTEQLMSSLSVSDGSSGAPVLMYESGKGVVIGMVAFVKNLDNFTGGPNLITLKSVYNKLIELNTKDFKVNCKSLNFNGKTGKGYIGIVSYDVVDEGVLTTFSQKFKAFNKSVYRNMANGVVVLAINNNDITIPHSRVQNAKQYHKCDDKCDKHCDKKCGVKLFDIILEVDGLKVGLYDSNSSLNNAEYFRAGKTVKLKVLRPETAEILYFKVLCDEYPASLEYVSVDSTIRLIGFFTGLGEKAGKLAGGYLGGLIDDYFGL